VKSFARGGKKRIEEENARLAAEAAAVLTAVEESKEGQPSEASNELANQIASMNIGPDSDEEDGEGDGDDARLLKLPPRSSTSSAAPARLKDMGRKLGTKSERLQKEGSRGKIVVEDTLTTE
jgi:hypothetical protein